MTYNESRAGNEGIDGRCPESVPWTAALWWNAWTRMFYLVGRHAEVDLRAQNTITCRQCGQHYDAYEHGHMQGHDICAWSKFENGRWVIHCGYGSDFDLSEFWYIRDYPTEPVDGICDWCIRRMLAAGVIIDSGKELQP